MTPEEIYRRCLRMTGDRVYSARVREIHEEKYDIPREDRADFLAWALDDLDRQWGEAAAEMHE